jgi:general secretion pathway protein D
MRQHVRVVCGLLLTLAVAWSAVAQQSAGTDGGIVNFTFDQVDVRTFVKLVGEITGKRFVVGDDIEGKITVVSPAVKQVEVYPLFVSILESVGCSVVAEGDMHRVVALPSRATKLAPVVGPDGKLPESGLVTKVIRLEHVSASELKKVLATKAESGAGSVEAIEETNHLVITDSVASIQRVEALIAEVDRPGLARVTEIIPLDYASAEDIAQQLNDALQENASRAERLRRRIGTARVGNVMSENRTASVVAAPHANSLIAVGTSAQIKALRELIVKMDVDVPSGRGRLNAIFLHHLSAEEAAENITALLEKRNGGKADARARRDIAIQASPSSNALLVDANPGDFDVVKRLIDQLDQSPDQVHIEVVIMEVSNSEGLDLGVDLAAVDMPSAAGDSVVQGGFSLGDGASGLLNAVQTGVFPRGLSVGVAHGSSMAADGTIQVGYPGLVNIDAMKTRGNVKVLSETSLQSQNNKEASVLVVSEIPILTSSIQGGSGTSRDVIQNIERVDVGVKLKITPHVVPDGRIRMALNPSIEAVIDSGPAGTQFAPTIAKRQVDTTVTVEDGRTIIIAGLTREDEVKRERRVPVLGSIPLVGWLFRRTQNSLERTDVLIFVTPTVVTEVAASNALRERWEGKTGLERHDD